MKDFEEVIRGVLSLLPAKCKVDNLSSYLDEEKNRWTVDVLVKNQKYSFSTKAIGGIWMDIENLLSNIRAIVATHLEGYIVVIPDIDHDQTMELLIDKEDKVKLAAKEGFAFFAFRNRMEESQF